MPKRTRESSSTRKRQLLVAQQRLRGSNDPLPILSVIRETLPVNLYSDLTGWLRSNPYVRIRVLHSDYPKTFRELEPGPFYTIVSADREFRWAGARLIANASNLSRFLSLSGEFQRSFLKDDYESCVKSLNSIETEFGQSLWLIKSTISLLQTSSGLEAHKRYANGIFSETGTTGFIPYIAFLVSMRNEPAVTPNRFLSQFDNQLSLQDIDPSTESYLRFHIFPQERLSYSDIAYILNFENSGAVIDLYETTLKLAQHVVTMGYNNIYGSIIPFLRSLLPTINDSRVVMLLLELERHSSVPVSIDDEYLQPLGAFLVGDFENARLAALEKLSLYPDNFDLMDLAARASAITAQTDRATQPFFKQLIRKMGAVVMKDAPIGEDIIELFKISINYHHFSWAKSLSVFLSSEITSNPFGVEGDQKHMAALDSQYLSPLRLLSFPSKATRQDIANMIKSTSSNKVISSLADVLAGTNATAPNLEGMYWEEHTLLHAEMKLRSGDIEESLLAALELEASSIEYYRQKSIRLRAHCLIELDRLDECIEFISAIFVDNYRYRYILPIERAIDKIESAIAEGKRARPSKDISLSIIYDMYFRYIGNKYDAERSFAYEDFLLQNGVSLPSQFKPLLNGIDFNKALYYLRNICVEPVMHRSRVFKSSREISEERIAVCGLLIEIDNENQESYEVEIRDTVQQITIQKRIRQIEQSKIYVDTDSLRATAEKNLKESFNRYISFLREGLDESFQLIQRVLDKLNSQEQRGLIILKLPKNEMEDVFRNLLKDLRDEFVSSPEHGLDKYLSVRIRHGTLSGELRKPLENHSLITTRDHKTGEYKFNEYWTARLGIPVNGNLYKEFNERLARFSKEFDQFVKHILSEWIQVKKDPEGVGLFNFSLTEYDATVISKWLTPNTTFEQFLDYVFEIFNDKLEKSLVNIRTKIDTEAKDTVSSMLTSLRTDLEQYGDYLSQGPYFHFDTTDISNAIWAARTGMLNAFNRVGDWFKLSKSELNEPFVAEEAVEISKGTLLRTSPYGFSVEISIINQEQSFTLPGKHLNNLVDIFINVFQNIIKHSDTESTPHGEVTITYLQDSVRFHIENIIGPGVASNNAISKIQAIKAAMREAAQSRFVITEGGTGLHKILRIIAHDFKNAMPQMDFGYIGRDRFFVDFTVQTEGLNL